MNSTTNNILNVIEKQLQTCAKIVACQTLQCKVILLVERGNSTWNGYGLLAHTAGHKSLAFAFYLSGRVLQTIEFEVTRHCLGREKAV